MKGKVGLIIGRFQPFHKGHLYLIKEALKQCSKVTIGIGSVNIKNEDNPFSFEERKEHIEASLKRNELYNHIVKIVPLDDYESDDVWLKETLKRVGKFDLAFGNNQWTNEILEGAGYQVVQVPLHRREQYEGTKIRRKMRASKNPHAVLRKHLP